MKRFVFLAILFSFVFMAPLAHAQQKYPLGFGNVAVKVDYFRFMDDKFEDADLQNGVYVGVEGYVSLFMPNLYFGVESGWAGTQGSVGPVDLETTYVPIEFNAKYVFEINPCLALDFGAGVSYNYFRIEAEAFGASADTDDWLVGGQFFVDLNYKFNPHWFAGINVKYQLTEDIDFNSGRVDYRSNISADNLRIGAQIGYNF